MCHQPALRGYARYTHDEGDEPAAVLGLAFARLTREVTDKHAGEVVEVRGDQTLSIFGSARQALRAAEELQAHSRAGTTLSPPLAIGLDAGEPVPIGDAFLGDAVNVAIDLCTRAPSGEVLASDLVIRLARRVDGLAYEERESATYAELSMRVWRIRASGIKKDPSRDWTSVRMVGYSEAPVRTVRLESGMFRVGTKSSVCSMRPNKS